MTDPDDRRKHPISGRKGSYPDGPDGKPLDGKIMTENNPSPQAIEFALRMAQIGNERDLATVTNLLTASRQDAQSPGKYKSEKP